MSEELISDHEPRVRPRRVAAALVVVGLLGMWGYVMYLALGPGRQDPPDRLEDPTFASAAQGRCSQALDQVASLPRATESETPAERASVVRQANSHFSAMLDDLSALAPPGEDGEIVEAWIADWRVYLDDREAYADAVSTDPEAQLFVSVKDNEQVTEYMDAFAQDNDIPACATPIDV